MFNPSFHEMFFTTHFVNGLREEIRSVVHTHLPDSVDKAALVAKIQQQNLDRSKGKSGRWNFTKSSSAKVDPVQSSSASPLWKERQIRDFRKANEFYCGEKFVLGHLQKCTKKNKPQLNALVVNDLNVELTDETLNQLAVEDVLIEEMGQLSLNAISGTEARHSMRIRALVHDQVMLILIDSRSSHSFVSRAFVNQAGLHPTPTVPIQVKVANGDKMISTQYMKAMEWWAQGFTFRTDMRVLELAAYDAVLGYDWLKTHNPMVCHWELKTLEFEEAGHQMHLEGIRRHQLPVVSISAEQVVKWQKGNNIWAMVVVHFVEESIKQVPPPPCIHQVLAEFKDVFVEPSSLPPHREYDHAVPLVPGAIPVNAKPYRYSPLHKDEIERQVKVLLQNGLIVLSTSPFASPVLLVQKKDGFWRFCVDYRRLNSLTIKNKFPMPLIDELLDELAGSQFFSKLDFKAGFHQVRMAPEDEYKIAFKTHHSHYQFKVMPFGLSTAPATFQCNMNHILEPFLRKSVIVFMDDILVYSPSLQQHALHLHQVLSVLRQHQFFC
jgi:hypothetical protein